jgi:hypothetical protein
MTAIFWGLVNNRCLRVLKINGCNAGPRFGSAEDALPVNGIYVYFFNAYTYTYGLMIKRIYTQVLRFYKFKCIYYLYMYTNILFITAINKTIYEHKFIQLNINTIITGMYMYINMYINS